jgi:hypothetical protein
LAVRTSTSNDPSLSASSSATANSDGGGGNANGANSNSNGSGSGTANGSGLAPKQEIVELGVGMGIGELGLLSEVCSLSDETQQDATRVAVYFSSFVSINEQKAIPNSGRLSHIFSPCFSSM